MSHHQPDAILSPAQRQSDSFDPEIKLGGLAAMTNANTPAKGHWWCPKCKIEVPWNYVTYWEFHEDCGYKAEWKELKNTPVPLLEPRVFYFVGSLHRYKNGVLQETIEHSRILSTSSVPIVLLSDYQSLADQLATIQNIALFNKLEAEKHHDRAEKAEATIKYEREVVKSTYKKLTETEAEARALREALLYADLQLRGYGQIDPKIKRAIERKP